MDDFVSLWLGFEYTFSLPTKIIILINFYISMTFFPVISFREAAGMFYKIRYIMVITAALKIMLSIVLGIHFQTAGILAATAIAKILTISWFEPKVLFGDFFGDSAKGYFIGQIVNFFILASCIALVYAVMPNMEIIGWMGWIVRGIILTLLINAVYLLRFYRKPEFQVLVGKAMGLINKKLG